MCAELKNICKKYEIAPVKRLRNAKKGDSFESPLEISYDDTIF